MYKILLVVVLSLSINCHHKINYSETIIKGFVKGLPSSKVYLTEAHNWNNFLDSATVENDKFSFTFKDIDNIKPFMASIAYIDKSGKICTLDFKNNILSNANQHYNMNSFILEKGIITVNGIANIREDVIKGTNMHIHIDSIFIKAGDETNALFTTQMMNFGYLDGDIQTRTAELNTYISIIEKYPNSRHLLSGIYQNKSVINKTELQALLWSFNPTVLKTDLGEELTIYLDKKIDNPVYQNAKLEAVNAAPSPIFDSTAKINMLVIWATWCGPCREEIPEIKNLNRAYNKRGLTVTSISIDKDKKSWKDALKIEGMDWKQLIVPEEKVKDFKTNFEVESIPYVFFLDSDGRLLNRFIGYNKNSIAEYTKVIESKIKIN